MKRLNDSQKSLKKLIITKPKIESKPTVLIFLDIKIPLRSIISLLKGKKFKSFFLDVKKDGSFIDILVILIANMDIKQIKKKNKI